MRPGALEEHTLKEAIQKMIKEFSDVSEVEIMLDYQLDKVDFENTKEDIIFRIVQESITNALRHGRAKKVEINIYQRVSDLEIVIADNGAGCDDLKLGYGLKQMQERAAILNGRLEYYSKEGFTVKVTIPMKEGNDMIKVLIADDQELIRESLKIVLNTHEDLQVIDTVEDGFGVLDSLKRNIPDVILMDIRMPRMDGVYCTKMVKEAYPDVEVFETTTIIAEGLDPVLYRAADLLAVTPEFPMHSEVEDQESEGVLYKFEEPEKPFEIRNLGNGKWQIAGEEIERAFNATRFNSEEADQRFARKMRVLNVDQALRDAGCQDGDIVVICDTEFNFID